MKSCLLFATELYAIPILRPLARAACLRDIDVAWLVPPALAAYLRPDERLLTCRRDARAFAPEIVFSAANAVPSGIGGLKVQVFHGFNACKRPPHRGHFAIRGFFDLYCTQGPDITQPFLALARSHRHFSVVETGWPKLDPWYGGSLACLRPGDGRTVVMYAPTFSAKVTSAPAMFDTIKRLVRRGDRYWLLTLHPLCPADWFSRFRALQGEHARFLTSEHLLEMMQAADVLVGDTSSVLHEFALQHKPVITLRNRSPRPFMHDVQSPDEIDAAIDRALRPSEACREHWAAHAAQVHPYRDGRSSQRVLDAAERLLAGELGPRARKPLNVKLRWHAWKATRRLWKQYTRVGEAARRG